MTQHKFEDYFWYGGAWGWSDRLVQKCYVCNQLREIKATGADIVRVGHGPTKLPRLIGTCLGAFGEYKALEKCAGVPVVEPQLG